MTCRTCINQSTLPYTPPPSTEPVDDGWTGLVKLIIRTATPSGPRTTVTTLSADIAQMMAEDARKAGKFCQMVRDTADRPHVRFSAFLTRHQIERERERNNAATLAAMIAKITPTMRLVRAGVETTSNVTPLRSRKNGVHQDA